MKIKLFYKILSLFSMVFGTILLVNSQLSTVGAVIGIGNIAASASTGWGVFFLITGISLFYAQSKEKQLKTPNS